MLSPTVITTSLLALRAYAAPLEAREETNTSARCKEVAFSVSGQANNYNISSFANGNLTTIIPTLQIGSIPLISVSGTQTLAGWYCEPRTFNSNSTKLQVFRGSFFTNRESWTALGGTALFNPPLTPYQPQMYSWVDYANNLGYPTLAIDTLGTGASSRPDPVLVAQIPYQLAIYHDLVRQIRAGTTGQLPRNYTTLIHIGNSLGSTMGSLMAVRYPTDFDFYILTGWSRSVLPSLPGVTLTNVMPAALVNSTRFAGVPAGYVTPTVQTALTNAFFGNPKFVDFDPVVARLFFQRKDTVSLGDFVTTYLLNGNAVATSYKGRVLTITGQYDQAYCGPGSSAIDPAPQGCLELIRSSGQLFPKADYNYKLMPRSGHLIVFQKTSLQTFAVAHQFLAGASFK